MFRYRFPQFCARSKALVDTFLSALLARRRVNSFSSYSDIFHYHHKQATDFITLSLLSLLQAWPGPRPCLLTPLLIILFRCDQTRRTPPRHYFSTRLNKEGSSLLIILTFPFDATRRGGGNPPRHLLSTQRNEDLPSLAIPFRRDSMRRG